ncbi:ImmA/IrrE family metallo-endopeptidase [Maritimibacter sp. DP07]|uniref:ImmA/IrrE family metallo-endopeptidase n=1 Tax=Maritimibacter harenae TaxID=2606218 RepID=A0A845M893_9RHOB|nr:ImmA/IrrE family metallo-endopeptidase [Maritimibacter harenae]MZR15389.1 ImmA/IrrE family metallo-endopeptidase [Maritimibacter harenae]
MTEDEMRDPAEFHREVSYLPPQPTRATKSAIMAFAEQQRKAVNLETGFQLADLIQANGGAIEYIGFMDEDQTDAIVIEPDGNFVVRLSSHTGELRDHFTLAHELGHKVLHWPRVRDDNPGSGMRATRRVDDSKEELVRCEWEANWFASAFLMPAEEFTAAYSAGNASETFGVTRAAVEVRAKTLGIR